MPIDNIVLITCNNCRKRLYCYIEDIIIAIERALKEGWTRGEGHRDFFCPACTMVFSIINKGDS